ncbi:helix-turn-helix transcriptional regulator [Streptomyces fulvoviolaceus]|uniref:helix-turn-helix transcriptional regulator n=1 Tax=Streptomyces fulvoviolaceus TaxID=285535 RepID=UPI0021BE3FBB|nr:helix-turn-helix transcriptional regulator [Streptomyces fulvoviolaceus]MCT9083989.1 helix-turn-helix transcriptional regulator [Streptomyces fulvoviolaceus]
MGRFLRAHRIRVTPEEVGLEVGPGLRRMPGLRREEPATLAGVSIDYYTRLERGKEARPSPSVVGALARVLLVEEREHEHLQELAVCAARTTAPEPSTAPTSSVGPGIKLLLESLRPNPAVVVGRAMDLLAWNPGGLRLFVGMEQWPVEKRNVARWVFLNPGARTVFDHWDEQIRACVGRLRALAGTDPDAPDLVGLVDELLAGSPEFAQLWEQYDVRAHTHGSKTFHVPDVGIVTLEYQSMQLEGTPGHRLVAHYATPGTPDHDKMVLLDMAAAEPDLKPAEEERT